MNRVEIKNFAKEKLSGNLGSIWKILIIALGISLASTCVLSILFNKMDADFLDSLLGILMMPLGIGTTAFFISLIENEKQKLYNREVESFEKTLQLKQPIYRKTASYGHFGREGFPWEKTDKVEALKAEIK